MAVVKSKRSEGELTVVTKAKELVDYSCRICGNEDVFPKRNRWVLAYKIIENAQEIEDLILKANSVFVKTKGDYDLRRRYQTEALAQIAALTGSIDRGYRLYNIESRRIKHWTGLVIDVQSLLRNWRNKDYERYKNLG